MPITLYILFLAGAALGTLALAAGAILAGYKWGCFAAFKALAENSPKWQAYLLATLPPAGFAAAFGCGGDMAGLAWRAFCALAAPALIGACLSYNRSSYSAF